jgi:beta-lactam-binding protein with PASTA domain
MGGRDAFVSRRGALRAGWGLRVGILVRVVGVLAFLLPGLQDLDQPNLRGLSVPAALETLGVLDDAWILEVRNSVPDGVDVVPVVVDQLPTEPEPDGGSILPVNLGVSMPDVVGQAEQSALDELDGLGLADVVVSPPLGVVDDVGEPPTRIVLEQRPGAGELVAFEDPVGLLVGTSVETVEVPTVIGRDVQTARGTLQERGLDLRAPPEALEQDIVVTQEPEAGAEVAPDTVVVVTVTDGEAVVPDVVGEDVGRARELVTQARLAFEGPEAGVVSSQDPLPGTRAGAGSVVSVEVGPPVEGVTVPNLIGLTPDEAREALGGTLVLGPVQSAELVIAQTPAVGETVPRGSTVNVTQGSPTDDQVTVPTVVGLEVEQARVALERSGLTTDADAQDGTVLQQDPAAGSLVPRGTRVTLGLAVPPGDAFPLAFWVVGLASAAAITGGTAVRGARRRGRSWASRAVTLRPVQWQPRVQQGPDATRSVTIRVVPHAGRSRSWTRETKR